MKSTIEIRDLNTESIGISIPKEEYENHFGVKIPDDVWNEIVDSYNHGWDHPLLTSSVLKMMEMEMRNHVSSILYEKNIWEVK